ncbi:MULTISPECIES: enoyl-CoA hydratase/isomerase family protein [Actinomadura]|uniref:Enoyl-CoA hydratase n=1 Tax=Actinomadura madurae TaxID=1993 RepID=A0A1I5J437_9ACTN|nr:enoyl-CoA hydratase/isomerase family protein [Actinomadura madurae]URM99497.1 enoyl-CoA hydratase/isomerase family protein [Actinomadura madurae]URN10167.1 enoyl-CoA hydratase/isomerase family protein [Actinomadura madurae]SFO67517.1 enoyl-CoA hydratase [Actinomadura madurae]SPT58645.1 Probable enoyl-CoA hydratase echA8 [Actinomadura madurae]
MSETPADALLVERRSDGVAVLTLNDPDRRNAMSDELTAAWKRTIAELRADTGLRCVVVTGAGSAFSSGGDLSWLADTGAVAVPPLRDRMLGFYRTWLAIRDLEVPTIAAVNGHAVGAGLCLALACDLRYAADDAKLLAPFTALGLHPGMAATWLFPEVAGLPLAREMLLAGRVLTGAEAAEQGLVNRAFPRAGVLAETIGVAERIAGQAPIATRLTKVALSNGGHPDMESALRWESLAQPVTMSSRDMLEGLAAQREKRSPNFTGD